LSTVRPYPVSVALDGAARNGSGKNGARTATPGAALGAQALLEEFGVRLRDLALGVDRLDYTKGIVERLMAIEHLLEEHPWHRSG
jgi:trehalose-6-phosphate synthase